MEKALAEAMAAAGYHVFNEIACRAQLDVDELFATVRGGFAELFPQLG